MSLISDCHIINLGKITSDKGTLTFAEKKYNLPFDIKRVYYTYDIPTEAERGGHAHKNLFQVIVAVAGSFNVIIDDGLRKKKYFFE